SDSLWHYVKMLHAAMFVINPKTGGVKVWVGGNHFRYLPYDLVLAKRPAASTFKPFLYSAALENGLTPCTYLSNKQKIYKEYDDWEPQNYNKTSGGHIAMWYALMKSMNLPTIDLYFRVGHKNLEYITSRLGIASPLPEVPSVALGVKEMSLKEIVKAYAAFASSGILPEIQLIERIEDNKGNIIFASSGVKSHRAISNESAEQLTTMLINTARNGTGKSLYSTYNIKSSIAAKTGTSQDFKDARFVFYNKNLVGGIWVGATNPAIHFNNGYNGSGSTLALPIAGRFIKKCEQDRVSSKFFKNAAPDQANNNILDCPGKRDPNIIKSFIEILSGDLDKKTEKIKT
ncbi:MAG: penicillin-binding transpeptidase domain-containing protein, partial [Bacteroidota bacterium]|nr:penicillin-binding transpeptidase domain-containing protein [Bacteroidota bacterium]